MIQRFKCEKKSIEFLKKFNIFQYAFEMGSHAEELGFGKLEFANSIIDLFNKNEGTYKPQNGSFITWGGNPKDILRLEYPELYENYTDALNYLRNKNARHHYNIR